MIKLYFSETCYKTVKNIAVFAIFFTVLFINCTQPQDALQAGEEREYNGFRYEYYEWGIQIKGYTGSSTDINIPSRIENIPVVFIRGRQSIPNTVPMVFTEGAFENKGLTSVAFPNTVGYINHGAFAGNKLTEVQLPDKLVSIGAWAFTDNRLNSVVIPDSIRDRGLGLQAFENNQITEVTIGGGVEFIEYAAFRNNKITSLTIPPNVIFIHYHAFADNEISELNLTEGLDINSFAFENNRLTNLSIPAGVRINGGAFLGNNITSISIDENVELYPGDSSPVFELGFDEFFHENDGKAGTYMYENNEWKFISAR